MAAIFFHSRKKELNLPLDLQVFSPIDLLLLIEIHVHLLDPSIVS
jgi:hypothetical protein